MTEVVATNETILVVGGGISGMTAALEAAETGKQVVLVEKRPYLGGRVSQLYKYFPKLCHPTCGLEINQRRTKMNPNLTILTMAEVTGIEGEAGAYTATVKLAPRYVNENCTGCGECAKVVEAEFDDERFRTPALKWIAQWSAADREKPFRLETRMLSGHTHLSAVTEAFRLGVQWLFEDDSGPDR